MIRKALVLGSMVMLLALFAGTALAAGCCGGDASWTGVSPGRAGWGASGSGRAALPACCQSGANPASTYGPAPACCQTGAASIPTYTPTSQLGRPTPPTVVGMRTTRGPVRSPYTMASFTAGADSAPARSLQIPTVAPSKPALPPCCEVASKAAFGQGQTIPLLAALSSRAETSKSGTARNGVKAGNAFPVVQTGFAATDKPTVWNRPAASPALVGSAAPGNLASGPSCCTDAGTPVKPLKIVESPTGSYFTAPMGCGRVNCAGRCSLR